MNPIAMGAALLALFLLAWLVLSGGLAEMVQAFRAARAFKAHVDACDGCTRRIEHCRECAIDAERRAQ